MQILLGVTGGIAAFKAATLIRAFTEQGHQVRVIATENALRFIGEPTLANLSNNKVYSDLYAETENGAHIELADWAEKIVVAPATASFLGRMANGIATDLLTNVIMASDARVYIAPAMHSNMYTNTATVENVAVLRDRGMVVIEPAVGRLSGEDSGVGRLPEPEEIVNEVLQQGELAGLRAVVTLGGTSEPIDSVRYLGNRSSGKQGLAFAKALQSLGAEVSLIAANTSVPLSGFEVTRVNTHNQLRAELSSTECDLLVMAAAVSDFTAEAHPGKLSRGTSQQINLIPTKDIVASFKQAHPGTFVLAFSAADSNNDWIQTAIEKRISKGVDAVFANTEKAFDSDVTEAVLVTETQTELSGTKQDVANQAVSHIADSLKANFK